LQGTGGVLKFNISMAVKGLNQDNYYFYDELRLVAEALRELGHVVDASLGALCPRSINLLWGCSLLHSDGMSEIAESGIPFVVVDSGLFPISQPVHRYAELQLMSRALVVWTPFRQRLEYLSSLSVKSAHLRFGYHGVLEPSTQECLPKWDFACWGPSTAFRISVLENLQGVGFKVRSCLGQTHLYRDDALRSAGQQLLLPLERGGPLMPMEVNSSFYHSCPGVALLSTPTEEHEFYCPAISLEAGWEEQLVRLWRSEEAHPMHDEQKEIFRSRPFVPTLAELVDNLPGTTNICRLPSFEDFLAMGSGQ
jgi:hypothetical protein